MIYYKFTDPQKLSGSVLRSYLVQFENKSVLDLDGVNKTELIGQVKSFELKRRPKRGFTFVIGTDPKKVWNLFDISLIKDNNYISVSSVETPKVFGNKKCLPYRTLIFDKDLLIEFFADKYSNCSEFLKHKLKLRFIDESIQLFFPIVLFTENYIELKKGNIFNKASTVPSILLDSESPSENSETSSEEIIQSDHSLEAEHLFDSNTENQASAEMALSQIDNQAISQLLGGYQIPLANIWNPDTDTGNSVEDVLEILKLCQESKQYKDERTLIMSFLGQNGCIGRLKDLTNDQLTKLDKFGEWLLAYRKVDIMFYKSAFRKMTQGTKAFRTFMYDLVSTYRKAHQKDKQYTLTDSDKRSILAQFIKGIADPRIKTNLVNQTADAISIDGSTGTDAVQHCEHLKNNYKQIYYDQEHQGVVTQNTLNIVEAQTETNTQINMLQEEMQVLQGRMDKIRCYNCHQTGHMKDECRAKPKNHRKSSQSRDRRSQSRGRDSSNDRGRSNNHDQYSQEKSKDRGRSGDRRSHSKEKSRYPNDSNAQAQQMLNSVPGLGQHFAQPPYSPSFNPYYNHQITHPPDQNFQQGGYNNRNYHNNYRGNDNYRGNGGYKGNGHKSNGYKGNGYKGNGYKGNNGNYHNNGNYRNSQARMPHSRNQQVTFNCNHFRRCPSAEECHYTSNMTGN